MLDKLMDRLMESAASAYMPKLEEIAEARKAELADMKSKVRDDPEQVEMWFDKEISKLSNIDVGDMMGKLKQ
jgi:hypothetical protein